jgi:hypothetical protein
MKKMVMMLLIGVLALSIGCTQKYDEARIMLHQPINCKTAEGDIRMLMHEKAHVEDQILQGVSAFSPAGLVVGLATGTEDAKMKVASGEYNDMIDKRIAEIKKHCGIK